MHKIFKENGYIAKCVFFINEKCYYMQIVCYSLKKKESCVKAKIIDPFTLFLTCTGFSLRLSVSSGYADKNENHRLAVDTPIRQWSHPDH